MTPLRAASLPPSSVAYIMTQKYMNATPLYRQEQILSAEGIHLSRQTMANWVVRYSEDYLEHIYGLMRQELLAYEVLHADETVLQVLREASRSSRSQSDIS